MDMFSSRNWSYKLSSLSAEASASSGNTLSTIQDFNGLNNVISSRLCTHTETQKTKKRRGIPGNPDPDAEVIALSPKTLLATNRFVCEICNKGFQRDQNLQLHRRGHNLPWKLKQKNNKEQQKKKVYVCPETNCVHHHPSRALGDLTGIKKHFCRKHGEKKWKCEKCSKFYAVQSDWKAHTKVCGTREYRCDCGTLFSRKDSFITHRAFCDALAEENARIISSSSSNLTNPDPSFQDRHFMLNKSSFSSSLLFTSPVYADPSRSAAAVSSSSTAALSATALLQKATALSSGAFGGGGQTRSIGHHQHLTTANELLGVDRVMMMSSSSSEYDQLVVDGLTSTWQKADRLTRDFLGLTGHGVHVSVRPDDMLEYAGGLAFPMSAYDTESHNHESSSFQKAYDLGFYGPHNM